MNEWMQPGYVGIMVCEKPLDPPFADQQFYRRLCTIGHQLGMQVFVFTPDRLLLEEGLVEGHTFSREQNRWIADTFPLPQVVYDRCFYKTPANYRKYQACLRRIRQRSDIRLLGNGLSGKWRVHQNLMKEQQLRPYLPQTRQLASLSAFLKELHREKALFLKPEAGSQGKGALRVRYGEDGYEATGRTRRNEPFVHSFQSERHFLAWLAAFTEGRAYLVQPYLRLTARNGDPFDVRCLLQKNRKGLWTIVGTAVRRGQQGNVTSNLHGGGVATDLMPFLNEEFGHMQAERIRAKLHEIAAQIPEILEHHHGRLAELGLDLGIDASGAVWILEANSKPGRAAFKRLADPAPSLASVRNPILYARYLLDTTRRVIS